MSCPDHITPPLPEPAPAEGQDIAAWLRTEAADWDPVPDRDMHGNPLYSPTAGKLIEAAAEIDRLRQEAVAPDGRTWKDVAAAAEEECERRAEQREEQAARRCEAEDALGMAVMLKDAAEAQVAPMRAALGWLDEVYPAKNRDGAAVVLVTWEQWNAMRAAMGLRPHPVPTRASTTVRVKAALSALPQREAECVHGHRATECVVCNEGLGAIGRAAPVQAQDGRLVDLAEAAYLGFNQEDKELWFARGFREAQRIHRLRDELQSAVERRESHGAGSDGLAARKPHE